MEEMPEIWEVVCKHCMAGFYLSEDEVKKRLYSHKKEDWFEHCGRSMQLRQIFVERKPKTSCSHTGCTFASNAYCSCDCKGKYHGVNNYTNIKFTKVIIKEPPWWKKPIREFITMPKMEFSSPKEN